jgi:nitrite reductase/ring-hydroxylating ferredoxin subunit
VTEIEKIVADGDTPICARNVLIDGGKAVRFMVPYPGRAVPCFVIAFDGEVHAYVNSCPHRGTELDWQPGEVFDESGIYLVCATHAAMFEADSGRCVGGPCQGAHLTRVAIEVKNEQVVLAVDR